METLLGVLSSKLAMIRQAEGHESRQEGIIATISCKPLHINILAERLHARKGERSSMVVRRATRVKM